MLLHLFEITSKVCEDIDKVGMNGARITGNLVRLLTAKHLQDVKWQNVCSRAVQNLTKQIKLPDTGANMKTKWNACYAIGNFLKNPVVFLHDWSEFSWQKIIYPTLADIIVNCGNFKVRINGTIALAVPTERSHYGQYYHDVWAAMLAALQQANHLTDFNEYIHRDKLIDQLCLSISHLITKCTVQDLGKLESTLLPYIDITTEQWLRVMNRMIPEKAALLIDASNHLKSIGEGTQATQEQKRACGTLSSCFSLAIE